MPALGRGPGRLQLPPLRGQVPVGGPRRLRLLPTVGPRVPAVQLEVALRQGELVFHRLLLILQPAYADAQVRALLVVLRKVDVRRLPGQLDYVGHFLGHAAAPVHILGRDLRHVPRQAVRTHDLRDRRDAAREHVVGGQARSAPEVARERVRLLLEEVEVIGGLAAGVHVPDLGDRLLERPQPPHALLEPRAQVHPFLRAAGRVPGVALLAWLDPARGGDRLDVLQHLERRLLLGTREAHGLGRRLLAPLPQLVVGELLELVHRPRAALAGGRCLFDPRPLRLRVPGQDPPRGPVAVRPLQSAFLLHDVRQLVGQ